MPTNPSDIQPLGGEPLAAPDFQTAANSYNLSLAEVVVAVDLYPSVLGNFVLTEVITGVTDTVSVFIPSSVRAQDVQPLAGDPLAAPDFPDTPGGTNYNVSWTDTLVIVENYAHTVKLSLSVNESVVARDNSVPTYGPIVSLTDALLLVENWVVSVSHATFPSFGRSVRLPWYTKMADALRIK